jgi:hypothetical protein
VTTFIGALVFLELSLVYWHIGIQQHHIQQVSIFDSISAAKNNDALKDVTSPRNNDTFSVMASCSPENLTPCTHRKLAYNLYSSTNQGHLFLDDLLNLILYKPEIICNAGSPLFLKGILDYAPEQIHRNPCEENFLYYGYYQTSLMNFQVKNRIRIARFTQDDLSLLFAHVAQQVKKHCSDRWNRHNGVLYIQRLTRYGRALPDKYVVPKTATRLTVDIHANSTIRLLCAVAKHDLVIVPWGSELVLPIVLKKPFVALKNNWTDIFYYEVLHQQRIKYAELYLDSKPSSYKPEQPYYNNFEPSSSQLASLKELVTDSNYSLFVQYPNIPNGKHNNKGFLRELRLSRRAYLDDDHNA